MIIIRGNLKHFIYSFRAFFQRYLNYLTLFDIQITQLKQGAHETILSLFFHLANLSARTDKKVGTVPTCSRQIFSSANFRFASREQSRQVENRLKSSDFCRPTK